MKNQTIYDILTQREIEIITLVAKGYTGKEIAERCFISYETVRNHYRNILQKTQQRTIASAVCFAMKKGVEF